MKRHALARRSHRRMPVRKNFVFLLPLAVPILLGGVSVAAILAAKKKAESMVSLPAVAGAGVGYIAARAYKQDIPMQLAATAVGYAAGMMISNAMQAKEAQAAAEQSTAQKAAGYWDQLHWYDPSTWFAA